MSLQEKYSAFDFLLEGVQILDAEDRYLYLNEAAARHARRNIVELLGAKMTGQYPGIEKTELYLLLEQCRNEQANREMVNEFVYPDGGKGFFKIRMQPVPEGVLIMSIDISEIKKEELKTSSQRLAAITNFQKAILDNTTDGIVLIGADHKVLSVNKQMQQELLQYFKKTIEVGDDYRDFVVDARMQLYMSAYGLAISGQTIEVEDETTAGEVSVWYMYKVNPVYDQNGEILGVALTASNIDQRKRKTIALKESKEQLEQLATELEKYNHELMLLTKVNDIILSATSEQELYEAVCKCVVMNGGYKLAWVCLKPQGQKDGLVSPIASYGVTAYLNGIEIDLGDPILSKGPTATVLTTGKTVINNNASQQPFFKPWLERASQYGISASIVLPLALGNDEAGTLNIYSDVKEPFVAREVMVLERIASNLSLATKNLRSDLERRRAKHMLNERVKELSTIYNLHRILQHDEQSADEVFEQIVSILPLGWQYPEICEASILFNEKTYRTANFHQARVSQQAPINLQDGRRGVIEVAYTENRPAEFEGPFLAEERYLINTIANIIEVYFNKKNNQDNLLKSEVLFRSVFEYSAIGMAVVSLKGEWLRVNDAICTLLGYTKEELAKKTFQELTYPPDLANDLYFVNQAKAGLLDSYRVEKRYVHKNGTIVWGNLNVSVVRDPLGNAVYFVSQIENITERIESQRKFFDLVEKSPVGVYIYQNDRYAYANPQMLAKVGYTEEELYALPLEELIHEDDLQTALMNVSARLSGEKNTVRYEIRVRKKDGSILWVEIFGSVTIFKGEPAIIGTVVDVTAKKAAFERLKESEANLRSIFDTAPALIMLLNKSGDVIAANKLLTDHYKALANHELKIGEHFIDTAISSRKDYLSSVLSNVAETRQPYHYEYNYDNSSTYFSAVWSPVISEDKIIGFLYFGFDISRRKHLEIERQKILADLVRRNNELQDFAQMVSHNLRGPLATILGLTNMFSESTDQAEKEFIINGVGEYAEKLDAVVREMNDLLHAKDDIAEGKATVYLAELLAEIKEKLQEPIANTQAEVICEFDRKNEVTTTRSYLKTIIYNLLSNSLKFRSRHRKLQVHIWLEEVFGTTKIYIRDNGIGIDLEKYREQLFMLNKKFDQRANARGLGLFLVKVCVEIINGEIDVESTLGEGTTFIITLPNEEP